MAIGSRSGPTCWCSLALRASRLAAEPHRRPRRHRGELEQRRGVGRHPVVEAARALVEADLEHAGLDAVVEPRAAEDQLTQPIAERLRVQAVDLVQVLGQIPAELALRL